MHRPGHLYLQKMEVGINLVDYVVNRRYYVECRIFWEPQASNAADVDKEEPIYVIIGLLLGFNNHCVSLEHY